jgi:hypothetical protein
MAKEEYELSIRYLECIKDDYIEHFAINGHEEINAVPEYYAIENAIKALEQQAKIIQIIDDYDLEAWEVLKMIKEVMRV